MEHFFNHYNSLSREQKKALRKRVIKTCMIEPPTFYSWMKRQQIPLQAQKLIKLEFGNEAKSFFTPQHN